MFDPGFADVEARERPNAFDRSVVIGQRRIAPGRLTEEQIEHLRPLQAMLRRLRVHVVGAMAIFAEGNESDAHAELRVEDEVHCVWRRTDIGQQHTSHVVVVCLLCNGEAYPFPRRRSTTVCGYNEPSGYAVAVAAGHYNGGSCPRFDSFNSGAPPNLRTSVFRSGQQRLLHFLMGERKRWQTLGCGRPSVPRTHAPLHEWHIVSAVGTEKFEQPQFAGFGNTPGNRSLAAHTVFETCLFFQE